ncbi:Bug family tripartite tricarboxylate transporter substrate binding protein [Rhizobium terrae]|uniref:Bug family tripartite tricarboxylate transporter substrate binding protein n=1 Tax=Rhizobium terrae TaxID=2171756 RepID=UPI000E3BE352|nr:tripartite tricarboxylate transporter substrate binding protein [Rhizobium terrae]
MGLINRFSTFVIASALALGGTAAPSLGQEKYPSRTIEFVAAFPGGSGADVLVRYFAQKIGQLTGATTFVTNKPGAGGNIATEYTVRAKPDGYTIYIHSGSSVASSQMLMKAPTYDVAKDLQVAATINQQAFMIAVDKASPYSTLQDLTTAMKEKKENASYGIATATGKILGVLYSTKAGISPIQVSYKQSSDATNDMKSGTIDFAIIDPVLALAQQRNGESRLLAIASGTRMKSAPDVPTMTEGGVAGINLIGWFAAMVPAQTPKPIVDQINGWFKEILAQPDTVKFVQDNGGDVFVNAPEKGQELLKHSLVEWGEYIKIADIPKN